MKYFSIKCFIILQFQLGYIPFNYSSALDKQPLFNPVISDNLYLDEGGNFQKGFSLCACFQSIFVPSLNALFIYSSVKGFAKAIN